jgi:hypothetical protein
MNSREVEFGFENFQRHSRDSEALPASSTLQDYLDSKPRASPHNLGVVTRITARPTPPMPTRKPVSFVRAMLWLCAGWALVLIGVAVAVSLQ